MSKDINPIDRELLLQAQSVVDRFIIKCETGHKCSFCLAEGVHEEGCIITAAHAFMEASWRRLLNEDEEED